ncbi:Satratoxin biosynthesis SC1 cluster protein 4 [Colletotrichum sidae]|uniref:Satratoxin biosynthesis SC1 cluster protein 4 n=1 Tax=Colletotrichum sidae TaxID=1347389 RepID=A0A4R8T3T1_9PEZI|nr:Satratoxin biosynthesis SC1 cluster protein 4 [Colletotrichum sidae]
MKLAMHVATAGILAFATVAASSNATSSSGSKSTLLAATPDCAMPCFLQGFHSGNCTLADLTDCVCTNTPLQARVSACVQVACTFQQQVETAYISQELCHGYPIPERRRFSRVFSIVLPTISAIIVALRCLARLLVTRQLWWDDWTALMALFFLFVSCACGFASAELGFGLHYWNIEPGKGKTILQLFYVMQMIYIFVQFFAKASICCFFARVFIDRQFHLYIRAFVIFMMTAATMFLFLVMFQCLPIQSIWDRTVEGHCLSLSGIGFGGAALSIFEDLVLFIMPIPELLKLQLGPKKKLALVFMFGIASVACIASMIRLKYLISYANTFDSTWDNVDVVLWSSIELNLAIVCGSLPALRPLFKKIPGLLSTVKETAQSEYRRRSQMPSNAAKSFHSRQSRQSHMLSSEASQLKALASKPSPHGKTMHVMTEADEPADNHSREELRRDWVSDTTPS